LPNNLFEYIITVMKTLMKTVCDHAFLSLGNKLNIIGIFDNITANKFPTHHLQMFLVFKIEDAPRDEEVEYYFTIEDSKGNIVMDRSDKKGRVNTGSEGKINAIFNIVGTKFEKPDKYKIIAYFNDYKDYLYIDVKESPRANA